MSLVSSLSVTMDRYGDRDSASELLATHQNGELPPCSSALNEMANVKHPGHILQMKCLESGHLATLTTQGIHIWDSELQQNISLPLTTYVNRDWRTNTGFRRHAYDAILCKWDMTNAVTAANYEMTDDETLITSSAMTVSSSRGTYRRDPVFDCEWNPQDEHTFMTAHAQMIRIWDARMLSKSADQVELNYGLHNLLYRARWSPHHRHLIAGLCTDGQLRIWCTDTTSKSSSRKTGDKHELLFIHGGHQLAVSDFAWCPYMEDTIASVAPSTELQNGEIQVWRPRNLLDDPDNMDP
ncbi:Histone-binding protein rbbp4 [Actinomortierella wolfii]|nr:Histone-binding protein rbbp4 [Actinomortierella wolfii]